MPPATITVASPARMDAAPSITAFRPEPHSLVDGRGADPVRQPGLARRLAGRGLARAGLDDLAHEDLVHGGRVHARAFDGGTDGDRTEVRGGGHRGKAAAELADGRPGGGQDEDVGHAFMVPGVAQASEIADLIQQVVCVLHPVLHAGRGYSEPQGCTLRPVAS